MNLLKSVNSNNLDLADFVEVLSYTADAQMQVQPILRLQDLSGNGGNYNFRVLINDSVLLPDRPVFVTSSLSKIFLTGRPLVLEVNDTMAIAIQGNPNDIAADVTASLYDITPSTAIDFAVAATPYIIDAVSDAISTITINVRPETKVICPEGRTIKAIEVAPCDVRQVRRPKYSVPTKA